MLKFLFTMFLSFLLVSCSYFNKNNRSPSSEKNVLEFQIEMKLRSGVLPAEFIKELDDSMVVFKIETSNDEFKTITQSETFQFKNGLTDSNSKLEWLMRLDLSKYDLNKNYQYRILIPNSNVLMAEIPSFVNRAKKNIYEEIGDLELKKSQVVKSFELNDCLYSPKLKTCIVSQSCKDANLSALSLIGLDSIDESVDWCSLKLEKKPPLIDKIITEVKDLNQKLLQKLNIKSEDFFPKGIRLTVLSNNMGVYSSSYWAERGHIIMGAYPENFSVSSLDNTLDSAVYLHELGHYLTDTTTQNIGADGFRELMKNGLFFETFSDWLALLFGDKVSTDILPVRCETRRIKTHSNYLGPRSLYDITQTFRKTSLCCDYLNKQDDKLRPLFWKNVCIDGGMFNSNIKSNPIDKSRKITKENVNEFPVIDPHLIGIPINSFFKILVDEKVFASREDVALKLMSLKLDSVQKKAICKTSQKNFEFLGTHPGQALKSLSSHLNSDGQKKFEQIWKAKNLDIGISYGEHYFLSEVKSDPKTCEALSCKFDNIEKACDCDVECRFID